MLRSEAWGALNSPNQQVGFLYGFARQECGIILSAETIGFVFDIQASHIQKNSRAKTRMRPSRRPTAIKPNEEKAVI
jgi:hypothetical protein